MPILFTTLTTKTYGKFEGASKQSADLRILQRWDRAQRFWNSLIRYIVLSFICGTLSKIDDKRKLRGGGENRSLSPKRNLIFSSGSPHPLPRHHKEWLTSTINKCIRTSGMLNSKWKRWVDKGSKLTFIYVINISVKLFLCPEIADRRHIVFVLSVILWFCNPLWNFYLMNFQPWVL